MESFIYEESSNVTNAKNLIHIARIVITVEAGTVLFSECVILIVLLGAKAFKTFLQRLFVWIVLSLIVMDTTRVANIGYHYNESTLQDASCEMLGFLFFWSGWCIYIFFFDHACVSPSDDVHTDKG